MSAGVDSTRIAAAEPDEQRWLEAAEGHYGQRLTVAGSRSLAGGYVSDDVRLYELAAADARFAVVWKRTSAREVAALRAVDQVPGIGGPWLLAHGESGPAGAAAPGGPGGSDAAWVLMPHHTGTPLVDGQPVPDSVYEILARVHAHYQGRPVGGLPVVDAAFWRRLCLDVALPAVRGAARRCAEEAGGSDAAGDVSVAAREILVEAESRLLAWSSDERMLAALAVLPATLAHGDLHRGNILEGPGGSVIIDWGGARIAPGGLDLAVLAEQGGVDHGRYRRRLAELTGRPVVAGLVDVEQQWALATGYVQYLGFAADCMGADRVGVMVDRASQAFDRLGPALSRL